MSKTIIINEKALPIIKESQEEVVFDDFFKELKQFLIDLLTDPVNAKLSDFFKNHGISKTTLLNRMLSRGIISKKETINEPNDADGKPTSMHSLSYKVLANNFPQKVERLYQYFFQ